MTKQDKTSQRIHAPASIVAANIKAWQQQAAVRHEYETTRHEIEERKRKAERDYRLFVLEFNPVIKNGAKV